MPRVTFDPSKLRMAVNRLGAILQHRKSHPTEARSDELYYELMLNYFKGIVDAVEEDKPLVAYGAFIPNEILYAFDLVPYHPEMISTASVAMLKGYDEAFDTSRSYGLPWELCSAHRLTLAALMQGFLPKPKAGVVAVTLCDNVGKSEQAICKVYESPIFFAEFPRGGFLQQTHIDYFVQQLEGVIEFLSQVTGKGPDLDRLRYAIEISAKTIEIQRTIYERGKSIPSPLLNRYINQFFLINWLYEGLPEGLSFSKTVLEDIENRQERQELPCPEIYRLLSLCTPVNYDWKLVNWLQREKGAALVSAPFDFCWQPEAIDLSQPLITLAHKCCYASPYFRYVNGPIEPAVNMVVKEAVEFRVNGVIFWATAGCRQGNAMARVLKDALVREATIPTLVLDMDVSDPSFASIEEMQEKIESFLERLEL